MIFHAGSGITPQNAKRFKEAGLKEIHSSASKIKKLKNNTSNFNESQTVSDIKIIEEILRMIS